MILSANIKPLASNSSKPKDITGVERARAVLKNEKSGSHFGPASPGSVRVLIPTLGFGASTLRAQHDVNTPAKSEGW